MTGTSLDLSQIRTDALSSAATFRALIGVDIASFATSAQGALADTALQPSDITSGTITAGTGDIDFDSLGGGAESPLTLTASAATETPLTVKGAASHTAPLQEWVNSSDVVGAQIDASQRFSFAEKPCYISGSGGQWVIHSNNGMGNAATFALAVNGQLQLPGPVVMGGSVQVLTRSGADVYVQNNTGSVHLRPNSSQSSLQADLNATAGETRILLWDVDKGSVQRVSIGAADSGGAGFKVLRIPN